MSKTIEQRGGKSALWAVAALSNLAVLTAPYSVRAQDGAQPPGGRDPAAIYIQAGADQEEIAKIRKIAAEFESKARSSYTTLMSSVQEMQRLSLEPNLDDEKILATQEQINKITAEMSTDRIKLLIASRKILTAEQRTKLVELLKQRRAASGQLPQ